MELRQLDILLYPPAQTIILLIAAVILRKRRKLAISLFSFAIISLTVLSIPFVSDVLVASLYEHQAIPPDKLNEQQAEAIVVLGGGVWQDSTEYDGNTLFRAGLNRTRYAAFIAQKTGLPILVSSGDALNIGEAEGLVMQRVLQQEYKLNNIWVDTESKNTFENARNSVKILNEHGIKKAFLVTSAVHMSRSMKTFEPYNIQMIPAPTGVYKIESKHLRDYIPHAEALDTSRGALHEYLGRVWYYLKGY